MNQSLNLDDRLGQWIEIGPWRHGFALAMIVVAAVIRWHHCLLASGPLIDEATYLAAFAAVADGRSPYEIGSFHYTPLFAWIGARTFALFGEAGIVAIFRVASLAGLATAAWISTAWFSVSWLLRMAVAIAFVALSPAAGAGLCTGNVSFAVIGLILAALIAWPRGTLLTGATPSGLALGMTVAAKPLAPLALVALLCHRPAASGEVGRRRLRAARIAGLLGGLAAALLLLPALPRLAEMSAQPIHPLSYARSFSLQRLLSLAGIEANAIVLVLAGALALVVLLRRLPLDRSGLLVAAVTASVLVTPIVWNHTLVLTLPIQAMALSIAWRRRRSAPTPSRRMRSYEVTLVALGALAIQFSEGVGAVDELSRAAQFVYIAVPVLTPLVLAAYVLSSTASGGLLRR